MSHDRHEAQNEISSHHLFTSDFNTGNRERPAKRKASWSHGCIRIPIFAARELSELLPIGTIVLVYDKVSFVSAKSWAENPKLKQAALFWNRVVDN